MGGSSTLYPAGGCEAGGVVGGGCSCCSSSGNSTCATLQSTYVDPVSGGTVTITTSGIGGPSCSVPASVPQGIGAAGTSTNPQGSAAEPISTGTGNYVYQHTDLSFDDHIAGLPLVFQRTYNSQDNFSGPLGNNWTHTFLVSVATTTTSGNVTGAVVKWGDGHGDNYTFNGSAFVPAPGVHDVLIQNPTSGAFTLTRKDGIQYNFSWDGVLQWIQNRNGDFISVSRDASENIIALNPVELGLSLTYNQAGLIAQVSDPSGRTIAYSYDANSNLISETDPSGNVTGYTYDSSNRLTSVTLPNGDVLVQNTYDSSNRVIAQTNARGLTTTLAYNTPTAGLTTITDPLGNKTIHWYDASTRLIAVTDALSNTTSYTYDANNNVASITDARSDVSNFTYDALGNLLTYTDSLGHATSFTYNAFSEPLTITSPLRHKTSLTYDPNGNLITAADALGNATAFTYDGNFNLRTVTDARGNTTNLAYNGACPFCVTAITDPIGNTTSFAYDAIDRLTSVTDPNGHTSSIAYDALSHVISVTDPLSNQTVFSYDTVGNLTGITDANGHATNFAHDAVGNLTGVTNALGHATTFTYDPNNNRTEFVNAKGKVTKFAYNAANRLVRLDDPLKDATSYVYDAVGNLTSITDANGKRSNFTYDKDNRLTKIAYADGSTVAYTFDADGNRSAMADSHGTTSYTYDKLDRVVSVAFPGPSTVRYAYDPVGNRASMTYADGKSVNYTYDVDNRLSQLTDWLSAITAYSYDPAGNPIGIAYPNTVTSALSYDAANRLIGMVHANGGAFRTLAYVLDNVGNRTAVTDNGGATSYAYDAINELLSATTKGAKTSWTYDPDGNRSKQTAPKAVATTYTYDNADRMLSAGTTTFTYDKNGNQLTETSSSGTTTATYDSANRLTSSSGPAGATTFAYDGDGNRITQTTPSGTYNYVNDTVAALPVVLNESGPDSSIDYAYGWGLAESSSTGFNYFYHLDGLGSVFNLTDPTGTVQETYSYDAWGNALTVSGTVGTQNKFRYTGQALDPGTGLYYLRARYYSPQVGRFLSKDPSGNASAVNLYAYAAGNPLVLTDLSGLCPSKSQKPCTDPSSPECNECVTSWLINTYPLPLAWVAATFNAQDLADDVEVAAEKATARLSLGFAGEILNPSSYATSQWLSASGSLLTTLGAVGTETLAWVGAVTTPFATTAFAQGRLACGSSIPKIPSIPPPAPALQLTGAL